MIISGADGKLIREVIARSDQQNVLDAIADAVQDVIEGSS